ncbi:unnamed protein product [Oikopleura dioica]|uniref:Uncharacterized protein n=1 Tax=Oikopleura dioica TaxID=34765 RepID=E4X479_OIKDI|nr:unnamed protein product [Oikopleura dioica]
MDDSNALRSPAFSNAMHFLETSGKPWKKVGLSPLSVPDQPLNAFVVLADRNHDGLGDPFDGKLNENAANDWNFTFDNYRLVVVEWQNTDLSCILLVPLEYSYADLSMVIEITIAFQMGDEFKNRFTKVKFPQLDKSWIDCTRSDELKKSTTIKDFCKRYAFRGSPTNELVVMLSVPFGQVKKEEQKGVAAAREYFLSINAKQFYDVNTTGRTHLAIPTGTFTMKGLSDKLRKSWDEFGTTTDYPATGVDINILSCFTTSELERAAYVHRDEPDISQFKFNIPTDKLIKRQVAYNKFVKLRRKPNEYTSQAQLAKELAKSVWKPIDPDMPKHEAREELPTFANKTNLGYDTFYGRLEYECRFIFETLWQWILKLKANPYSCPHDFIFFDKPYKYISSTSKKTDMPEASSPPSAFKPVRGEGKTIYVITVVYPEVEIVPVPQNINLDTVCDLRRSFKNLCRVSFSFGKPRDLEDPINVIKKAFDDKNLDAPRLEQAYRSFWQYLTSLMEDENDMVMISRNKIRSDTQKRIATNLKKFLSSMGASTDNERPDLLYSRFKYVFGWQQFKFFSRVSKMPPHNTSDLSLIAKSAPHQVEKTTIIFDKNKKFDLSSNENICKIVNCTENAGPFATCEYHLQMLSILTTENESFTSACRSVKSNEERYYAAYRFNTWPSWAIANNKSRARLILELVNILQGVAEEGTPHELLQAAKQRVGTGIQNLPWNAPQLAEKSELPKKLKEIVNNFNEIKKVHEWVQVEAQACGEFIAIEAKNKPLDKNRKYKNFAFVRKDKSTQVINEDGQFTTGNEKDEKETESFFADLDYDKVWAEFLRRANYDEPLSDEEEETEPPLELSYLHDLSLSLGCKLVIFANEENFEILCETFGVGRFATLDLSDTRHSNIKIIKQAEVDHANATFKRLVKASKDGCVSAIKPVMIRSIGQAYPPRFGSNSRSWVYSACFALSECPATGLFAENLAGVITTKDLHRKSSSRSAKRELHTFWTCRFLYFMDENEKLKDVGLIYGDIGLLTKTDLPGPNSNDMSNLRSLQAATDSNAQDLFRKRVEAETPHFPFGNALQRYGKSSLLSNDMSEARLAKMSAYWSAFNFTPNGSMAKAKFESMWILEGLEREAEAFEIAAERFDRSQATKRRQDDFEVASGLRNELRARADAEEDTETIFSDALISDVTDADMPWADDEPTFPLVSEERVQQVTENLATDDGSQGSDTSLASIVEVPIPIDHVLEEINFKHETEAGQIPDLSEVTTPPPTPLQLEYQELELRAKLARDQLMADNIRPGGRWDPKNIGLVEEETADMEKATEILKALGTARMNKNHLTGQNEDNTDKDIVGKFSQHLAKEKIVPNVAELAQKTKCSVRCITDNVARINLSGPNEAETDLSSNSKFFFHRADLAPNPEARTHLAEMGVKYDESSLVDSKNIIIEYDLETRQLIKKAALVACEDRNNDKSAPEEHAIHAILMLLLDPCQLTQYLACITVLNGELDASKIRQLIYEVLKATQRLGQVSKWAIHFLPSGQERF